MTDKIFFTAPATLLVCILLAVFIFRKPFLKGGVDEKKRIAVTAGLFTLFLSAFLILIVGSPQFLHWAKELAGLK